MSKKKHLHDDDDSDVVMMHSGKYVARRLSVSLLSVFFLTHLRAESRRYEFSVTEKEPDCILRIPLVPHHHHLPESDSHHQDAADIKNAQ